MSRRRPAMWPGTAYVGAVVFLGPGLLVSAVPVALALFTLGAAGLAAANPPLDAARLDIVPGGLWGRAESLRTVPRLAAEAVAPVTFGFVADRLGGRDGASGLRDAFLIMLAPLLVNGVLVLLGHRGYLRDTATAAGSDQCGRCRLGGDIVRTKGEGSKCRQRNPRVYGRPSSTGPRWGRS